MKRIIALAGNPNVGKSTVFNALTGLKQHTGNWPGKTVTNAIGEYNYNDKEYEIYDLPGTYSLIAHSVEEEVARDFINSKKYDAIIIVCDAVCLERNLNLVIQIIEVTDNVVVCVNLIDEAKKKKIKIDLDKLSDELGVIVIGTSARSGFGLEKLMNAVEKVIENKINNPLKLKYDSEKEEEVVATIFNKIEEISKKAITFEKEDYNKRDRKIDKILTNKWAGIPIMLLLLMGIFWITINGANYPSQLLFDFFSWIEGYLSDFFITINAPNWLYQSLVFGVYKVLTWVIAVMLPPMAIFFPLFTFLEDVGYLPRIAFNLDKYFQKCAACGKQALTMCMGFGCNAAGVVGCRIIDSPRERLMAIITNCFVPCNGRFPTIIAIITMFIAGNNSLGILVLTGVILIGIFMTFFVSKILSKTILKGIPSSFTLELPPYRKPEIGKVIFRSIFDRTIFVLGRALAIAAPAGLIIWILANVYINDLSLLSYCANSLDPFGKLLGLDGMILMAFILGFPANEIVVPIMIMGYMSLGNITDLTNLMELKKVLIENGWTWLTALCTMLFCLMHWPCSTTCLTIKKETKSFKWTLISFLTPTIAGIILCFIITTIVRILI